MSVSSIGLLHMLLDRLERISADSPWAHRASGLRGALFEALECLEHDEPVSQEQLAWIIQQGFWILEQAARRNAGQVG